MQFVPAAAGAARQRPGARCSRRRPSTGVLKVPENVQHVGWWDGSAYAGEPFGSTVIAGHVDSATGGIGFFARLLRIKIGDVVTLRDGEHRLRYKITSIQTVARQALATDSQAFDQTGDHRLVLITCTGTFRRDRGGYDSNLVVIGKPAGPRALTASRPRSLGRYVENSPDRVGCSLRTAHGPGVQCGTIALLGGVGFRHDDATAGPRLGLRALALRARLGGTARLVQSSTARDPLVRRCAAGAGCGSLAARRAVPRPVASSAARPHGRGFGFGGTIRPLRRRVDAEVVVEVRARWSRSPPAPRTAARGCC